MDRFLAPSLAHAYANVPLDEDPPEMPQAFLNASEEEWRKTLRKLARSGMLSLGPPDLVPPGESAGAFARVKPKASIRLICDRRPRNIKELLLGHVDLPSASRFTRLLLPSSHATVMSLRI